MRRTASCMHVLAIWLAFLASCVAGCDRRMPRAASGPPHPAVTGELRIVSLSPAAADIARALGLADAIVGRNSADAWTDAGVPPCGELGRIDYEALVAVRPTHVFVQEASMPVRLEELGRRYHWTVENLSLLTLDEIRASTRRIVDSLPAPRRPPARAELDRIEREMDAVWSPDPGVFSGRVLLLASIDPPAALGPNSFHVQVLQRLGGRNIPESGAPYITMNAEDVAALSPEAIVLIMPRDPDAPPRAYSADEAIAAIGVLGRLDLPATRDRRVAVIDDPKSHLPSTAMIALARELRRILAKWK